MATLAEFVNKIGFQVNQSDVAQVNNTMASMKSTATKLLGAVGIGLSISGIKNFIQDCITISSEVEEMQNKFNVVFKGMTEDVEKWAKDYSDAIGRNANDIKTYLADMQNLLVGFMGQDMRQEAAEMAEAMTTMALDLASFNNIDENVAVNAMQKAVMGETEAAKTLGAVLTDVTRAEAMMTLGLEGKYEALDQATKMQVNYQAIVNQSADAIGDCERSVNSYRSTLIAFQSKLKEIKTLVGQFFMPVAQKIIRWGTNGLTLLRDGVTKINSFAQAVGGAEYILGVFGSTLGFALLLMSGAKIKKAIELFKTLNMTMLASKAKILLIVGAFLLMALLVEDFIGFMQGRDSLFGDLLERAGLDADDFRERISNAFIAIRDFVLPLWEGFCSVFKELLGGLTSFWDTFGEDILGGIGSVLGVIGDAILGFIEWVTGCEGAEEAMYAIGEAIGGIAAGLAIAVPVIGALTGIASAISFLTSPIGLVMVAIAALIAIIVLLVKNWDKIREAGIKALDWIKGAWNSVATWFKTTVIDPVIGFFTGLWSGIVGVFQSILGWVSSNWPSILLFIINPFAGIFSYLYQNFKGFRNFVDGIVNGVSDTVTTIKDTIVDGFNQAIDWITSLPAEAVQWGSDIISSIAEGITNGIGKIGEAAQGIAGKISSFLHFSEPDVGPLSDFHTYMPDMIELMSSGIRAGRDKIKGALGELTGDMSAIMRVGTVSTGTAASVRNSSVSNNIVQNVEINNKFEGDRAGQEKSATAMKKASGDATSEMARALVFAK